MRETEWHTLGDVIGKYVWDTVLPPEDSETIRQNAFDTLFNNPQTPRKYTNYWLVKNGTKCYLDWSNSLLFDDDGNVEYVVCVGTDATERQRVEIELLKSEQRLRLAVRGSHDGLWDWNVATNEYYFSPRFKELLGPSPDDESLNRFNDFGLKIHPDDRIRTLSLINRNIQTVTTYCGELRLKHPAGGYR